MKQPKISIKDVYSLNPDKPVERMEIEGMSQQELREAYRAMINALAEAYKELGDLMEFSHWTKEAENKELINNIEQALVKAGVEL